VSVPECYAFMTWTRITESHI